MNPLRDIAFPAFATVVFAVALVFIGIAPSPTVDSPPEWSFAEPPAGWNCEEIRYCQNEQCGQVYALAELGGANACPKCGAALAHAPIGELTVLPPDTRISRRRYSNALGACAYVAVIVGGSSKRSIHRPELCLPAQGYVLDSPRELSVGGRPWCVLSLRRRDAAPEALAYTFFNQTGLRTSSHLRRIFADVWDRSVLNRIDRWAMVTVHVGMPGGFEASDRAKRSTLEKLLAGIVVEGGSR